tara:strand:- start:11796 stop:13001 length:1206 start_codon:yes stop_codon:yes gene_type:complete
MAIDYTPISQIVNDFQLIMDDTSYDKEAQAYQIRLLALQGLRELKFDLEQEVKTTTRGIDSSLTIDLPTDFVKLLRVGYKNSEDEFVSLGYKSNLSLDSSVAAKLNEDPYDENNPYFHTDMGRKYGVGGGKNVLGYYRVNRNDNTINFSSELSGQTVFIEYISDGISSTEPKNHIIKLKFNGAVNDSGSVNGINNGTILKIPRLGSSSSIDTYTFTTDLTSTPTSQQIQFNVDDSASQIAEKFSTVVNEGYPNFQVAPFRTSLKASQSDNEVLLIYTSFIQTDGTESLPLGLNSSLLNSNTDDSQTIDSSITNPLVSDEILVQLGVVGTQPRVHKFCEEALRSYIYYKYIQRKRGIPLGEKQIAKRDWFNSKRLARARMMNFNKEAAMQVSRKAFKQSPKL